MKDYCGKLMICVAAVAVMACDEDEVPKGPDLVHCLCQCVTETPSGVNTSPRGCTTDPTCNPSCGDLTCSTSGGCYPSCIGTEELSTIKSTRDVTLRVCVDASNNSHVVQACQDRCDDYANGSATECASALLTEIGLIDEISDVVPADILERIKPDAAASVADIIWEECGTWLHDSLTGTCGHASHGLAALQELLFCLWTPFDPLNLQLKTAFRSCHSTGSQLFSPQGCPQFTASSGGTPVDDAPLPATETVDTASSAITITGPDIETKTVRPSGSASTGRIGPVVLLSQLNVALPDTTLSIEDHDVALSGALLFLEHPVAVALSSGNALSFEIGQLRTILTGSVGDSKTSVGAVNASPVTGVYDETTGAFSLAGTFQLENINASLTVSLTFNFTNRPPLANAGPDQIVECGLQTREGRFELSAAASVDPDPGDSIARYVWTVGRQLAADGSSAVLASAQLGLGTRVATLTTIDTRGSMSRDTALITVVDTQVPVFPDLPPLINSLCEPGVDAAVVPTPVVQDDCSSSVSVQGAVVMAHGQPTASLPIEGGAITLALGTYEIEWTATDQSGNAATARQTLIVRSGIQASDSIDIGERATVRASSGGFASLANTGTGMVLLGVEANTGTILAQGDILLRNRSFVSGDVATAGHLIMKNGASVTGSVSEQATIDTPLGFDLSNVTFPQSNAGPVLVAPNEVRTLVPGSYSNLTVKSGAKLTLGSGTYFFTTFDLKPISELSLVQPVQIYVSTAADLHGQVVTAEGDPNALLFGFAGSERVFVRAPFPAGTFVAPDAEVEIAGHGPAAFAGQLFAKRIKVHPGATLICATVPGSTPQL
ncbi:MAG TPA: hypothetical protein VJN18_24700 [Polyangiaceae bacterium]|nr:hypothetical protein [Polyangiaceae bacterium]